MAKSISFNNTLLKLFSLQKHVEPIAKGQTGDYDQALDKMMRSLGVSASLMSAYSAFMGTETERLRQYDEYDMMDEESEVITTVLDIYSEDATSYDNFVGARCWCTSNGDSELAEEINTFLKKVKMDAFLPRIARNLGKYGDYFPRLLGKVKKGKAKGGIRALDTSYFPGDVFPLVKNRRLLGYMIVDQEQSESAHENLCAPWQFVHFALPGDSNFYRANKMSNSNFKREDLVEYGQSFLRAARKPHKRSKIMHDILAIARLTRSPLKRVFKFQTDTSNPTKAISDLAIFKKTMEKIGGIDKLTGQLNYEEMMNIMTQDIFLPIMKDSKGDFTVDTIGGQVDVAQIADVELFDNRLFMSVRVPKEHLNFGTVQDRGAAALKDIRYAKRINKLQAALRQGIREIVKIHYAMQERVLKDDDFEINMTSTSLSEDLERLDYYGNAVSVANSLKEMLTTFKDDIKPVSESRKHEAEDNDAEVIVNEAGGTTVDIDTGSGDNDRSPEDNLGDGSSDTDAGAGEPVVPAGVDKERIDSGYLLYYILKNVVKLPSFDFEKFYPGSEKYQDKEGKKKDEAAKRIVESNQGLIHRMFNKGNDQDLREAAEQVNATLEKDYLEENYVPKKFTMSDTNLTMYFEAAIRAKNKARKVNS